MLNVQKEIIHNKPLVESLISPRGALASRNRIFIQKTDENIKFRMFVHREVREAIISLVLTAAFGFTY